MKKILGSLLPREKHFFRLGIVIYGIRRGFSVNRAIKLLEIDSGTFRDLSPAIFLFRLYLFLITYKYLKPLLLNVLLVEYCRPGFTKIKAPIIRNIAVFAAALPLFPSKIFIYLRSFIKKKAEFGTG